MPDAMPDAPDVSVSIVSYNTRELLRACLLSLHEREAAGEAALEIIVADNGSSDGTLPMLRDEFPGVHVVETGGNIGYGRANNLALAGAAGRYFLVLNSDTEVQPGALAALRDFLDTHPDAGLAGARLILPDGSTQPSFAADPDLWAVLWEQIGLDRLRPRRPLREDDTPRPAPQIVGACLFVRREAYQAIGGFDPAYFMYFEDIDFCIRLRQAGWGAWYVPQAHVSHHLGASSAGDWQARAHMVASYNESRYYFFTRYGGRGQGRLLKLITLLGVVLRLGAWCVLSPFKPGARTQAKLFASALAQTWRMTPQGEGPP